MTNINTTQKFPFETLIKGRTKKSNTEKWYPTSVDTYRTAFKIDTSVENNEALLKNICYSMQYLEFLEKELEELELSSVLRSITIKNYVITGMSILEGLFTNIVKSNGLWDTVEFEEVKETLSNEISYNNDERIVIKNTILRKIEKKPQDEMKLVSLIKKLDKHHQMLEIDHTIYPALQRIRKLRNKVHLTSSINNVDHDYNVFTDEIKQEMQKILYEILTSDAISNQTDYFEFLNSCKETISFENK